MSRQLSTVNRGTVGYIGAYPPSPLPTAMFTLDLANATDLIGWQSRVIAIEPCTTAPPARDSKVLASINPNDPVSCDSAVAAINCSDIDLLCLQYSPDLVTPHMTENLCRLCRLSRRPIAVVVHAVEDPPAESSSRSLALLAQHVDRFVTMAHAGLGLLGGSFGLPRDRLTYIPHGAPSSARGSELAVEAKRRLGASGRTVLTTFGLLHSGKGIEDVLHAVARLVNEHPNLLYRIIGRTRACSPDRNEHAYHAALRAVVNRLGLERHTVFVDEYLPLPALQDAFAATDIYVHPDHGLRDQLTSGALTYAMAAGLLVIATPTMAARELVSNRRGYLYPFRDVDALARRIESVLQDANEVERMRESAYAFGRGLTWEDVGVKYVEMFKQIVGAPHYSDANFRFASPSSSSEASTR